MDNLMEKIRLVSMEARNYSYCPYSGYSVGAALLCESGRIVVGSNIENASYSATNCAERTAFFKAVSEGEKKFTAIAVSGGPQGMESDGYAYPCGICRQVMREFCDEETFRIFVVKNENEYEEYLLKDLLPKSFGPNNLQNTSKKQ